MHSYWIAFKERPSGCVEARDEKDAAVIAKQLTGFDCTSVKPLPYPADPRINKHNDEKYGVCPSFCFDPNKCCGNTSCPKNYSCVE